MRLLLKTLAKLAGENRGATAIEYGLILAVLTIAIVTALSNTGGGSGALWNRLENKVDNAM